MRFLRALSLAILLLAAPSAWCGGLFSQDWDASRFPTESELGLSRFKPGPFPVGNFVDPNEYDPILSRGILASAPAGVHAAVGTERGFIGAALNPHATHLLLIDGDPYVAAYNKVNVALLRAARSREDYLRLRFEATEADWAARGGMLADGHAFRFWRRMNAVGYGQQALREGAYRSWFRREGSFAGANYLRDDRLFERLSRLAKEGKIAVRETDLADPGADERLDADLAEEGLRIGVLDISNAWEELYLGAARTARLPALYARSMGERALLVVTDKRQGRWEYLAFTPAFVRGRSPFLGAAGGYRGELAPVDSGTIDGVRPARSCTGAFD